MILIDMDSVDACEECRFYVRLRGYYENMPESRYGYEFSYELHYCTAATKELRFADMHDPYRTPSTPDWCPLEEVGDDDTD